MKADWADKARTSRWTVAVELLAFAAVFAADARGLIFFSKVPYLLAIAWASLALRGIRWRDVGFSGSPSWLRLVLVGLAAGLMMEALELFVTQPALTALTGVHPDLSSAVRLTANVKLLAVSLLLYWIVAALGEELIFRGYLLNRLAGVFGSAPAGWFGALAVGSVIFGLHHLSQGVTGVLENSLDGLILGAIYLASGRNLIAPIVAHGVTDSLDSILIFMGRYPF